MSHGIETDPPTIGHPEFDRVVGECRDWLAERGELVAGSGVFRLPGFRGGLHSDFGPVSQDKGTNQDYALAWWPSDRESRRRSDFVLALCDGLTTSFRSESAAALACWVAIHTLVDGGRSASPMELAKLAFNEAGLTIGRLGDDLARDPQATCPEGQFISTWKYILQKGRLLQTTLTLAWLDRGRFHLAIVGDGEVSWRDYRGPSGKSTAVDRVLAACDLNNQQVSALGPTTRCVHDFNCWHEEEIGGPFLCALSTDGIGRAHGADPKMLLDDIERLQAEGADNPARQYIERAVRQRPGDFDDNLTLAVIRSV
jgi:hypothetical protein